MAPAGTIIFEFFLDLTDNKQKVRSYVNRTLTNQTNVNLNGTSSNVISLA